VKELSHQLHSEASSKLDKSNPERATKMLSTCHFLSWLSQQHHDQLKYEESLSPIPWSMSQYSDSQDLSSKNLLLEDQQSL
jgi:hypothetical protein